MAYRWPIKLEVAFGADLTTINPATWSWTDITSYLRITRPVTVQRGGQSEQDTLQPTRLTFTLNNSDGRFSIQNPTGAFYGLWTLDVPVRVSVDPGTGYAVRGTGLIAAQQYRWPTLRNAVAEVDVVCAGRTRGLQQGRALRSATYRAFMMGTYFGGWIAPVAYWPCEDGTDAPALQSAINGHPAADILAGTVSVGADHDWPGSQPLPTIASGGVLHFRVPQYTDTGTIIVNYSVKPPRSGSYPLLGLYTTGSPISLWQLNITAGTPDTIALGGYNSALTELVGDTPDTLDAEPFDQPWWVEVRLTQSGADVSYTWEVWTPAGFTAAGGGTEVGVSLGRLAEMALFANAASDGISIGHVGVGTSSFFGTPATVVTKGWAGETASIRIGRLAFEQRVAFAADSNPSDVNTTIGPQTTQAFIDQVRDTAKTDMGLVWEAVDSGLRFRSRPHRYNRRIELSLNHATGQVAADWQPTEDDLGRRNDVTVTRTAGSSARYQLPAVDQTSASYDPTVPVYDDTVTVNVDDDDQLLPQAQWRVHQGQDVTMRFPTLTLDFARNPTLIASWLACTISSRIQVTNPPPQLPSDPVDLHLMGYTESFTPMLWQAQLNCVSAKPWEVWELDSGGSTLTKAVNSSATSLIIDSSTDANRNGPPWSTTRVPYGIQIDGEGIVVTSMSTNTPGTPVAGAVSFATNANVSPATPAGLAEGDALFLLGAIGNAAATVNLPAGYVDVVNLGNVRLMAKYAASSESSPTVTFSGGGASDITGAVMIKSAGCSIRADASASSTNGSQQNIPYPALDILRDNCLLLVIGQKQDSWTSVATLGGATELFESSSATGNKLGLVCDYVVEGAASFYSPISVAAGSFTVTGGVAAVSKGLVVALRPVQTATATRSQNGVVKSLAVGKAVHAWRPGVLAL